MKLWKEDIVFPTFEELRRIDGMQYLAPHVLDKAGYHFLLGAAVVKHGGILRASFAQSPQSRSRAL